jgi:cellulose synthase (UDP-forming)
MPRQNGQPRVDFLRPSAVGRGTLLATTLLTIVYFAVIALAFPAGDPTLFALLILGEVFHVFQVLTYIWTVWDTGREAPRDEAHEPTVDVFITVAGEPEDVVAETVRAAVAMDYPSHRVYVLNDGFVAKKGNWREIDELARRLGATPITRRVPGGAKAGNINNATRETGGASSGGEIIVVFDADHVPHRDFLRRVVPHFADPKVGFVQAPQYYKNFRENFVTRGSWEQQELFFGPICRGKNRMNSATMCGTNMAIRRVELVAAGGMAEDSIAEDFLTGIRLHARGLKSVYVPEVLAEGLAPEDYLAYAKQQFRWARGALDVIGSGALLLPGLTWRQRLQYLSSVSFYFSGLVVAMNALIPIVYFFTGLVPIVVSTMALAAIFLPYIFLTLYVLQRSSNDTFTFRALAFSMGSFAIHVKAVWAAARGAKSSFDVTPKKRQEGNFVGLVWPHIAYVCLAAVGAGVALWREGLTASFMANLAWAVLNVAVFLPSIRAALPEPAGKAQLAAAPR